MWSGVSQIGVTSKRETMIKLPSYLLRNRFNCFYFRRAIPPDLRQYFAVRSIYKSLGTSERRQAIGLVAKYAALAEQVFTRLRLMAKKKSDLVREEMVVSMDLKDLGLFTLDFEAHEVEQGKELIRAAIDAAGARLGMVAPAIANPESKVLSWAIEKYCLENEKYLA